MPWEFHCQFCGSRLRVPENTAGKRTRCPSCGAEQAIPQPDTMEFARPAAASSPPFAPALGSGSDYEVSPLESPLASPYQAPRAAAVGSLGSAAARDRIRAPAIAIIVLSSVCLGLLVLALLLFALAAVMGNDLEGAVLQLLLCVVQFVVSVVMLVGAINMLKLRSRGTAMAGAILGMIPGISPCCVLGLPFGIWAISAMNDPEVARAFR